MQHPIVAALAHYNEDREPTDPKALDLPVEGRILEPLIGRMNVVSTEVPPQYLDKTPLPDPTRKLCRSDEVEIYEEDKEPFIGPQKAATMKVVQAACPTVNVRIRSDMEADMLKRVKQEGYRAKWGPKRYNRRRRTETPMWDMQFEFGEEVALATPQAVYLLTNLMHGQYMEEVPFEAPKPKRSTKKTTRRPAAAKKPKAAEVKENGANA